MGEYPGDAGEYPGLAGEIPSGDWGEYIGLDGEYPLGDVTCAGLHVGLKPGLIPDPSERPVGENAASWGVIPPDQES